MSDRHEYELGKLLLDNFDGAWGNEAENGDGVVILRSTDMRGGQVCFNEAARRMIPDRVVQKKRLIDGDILINKSSGSAHLIGASVIFFSPKNEEVFLCSNFTRCLRPNTNIVDSEYLYYYLQSPQFKNQIFTAQRTTTGLRNLKINEYLAGIVSIHQDKTEQRSIVSMIKECFLRCSELEELYTQRSDDITDLKRSLVFGISNGRRDWRPLYELVDWIQDKEIVQPQTVYQFAGCRSFGKGLFKSVTRTGAEFKYPSLNRLKYRDFIYPKLMAWEGAFGMVPKKLDAFVCSPEFVVFRPKNNEICSEVLDTYFRSPFCLPDVQKTSTGSNRRRRRLNPKAFLTLKVPVPSHAKQEQLRAVYNFEEDSQREWIHNENTLSVLRASILHKAFAGEL